MNQINKNDIVTIYNKNGYEILAPLTAQAAKYLSDKKGFNYQYSNIDCYKFDRDNLDSSIIFIKKDNEEYVANMGVLKNKNSNICKTKDIIINRVKNFTKINKKQIRKYKFVENGELITNKEQAILAIKNNPWNIKNIAMNILSDDLLKLALSIDVNVIESIINDDRGICLTEELFEYAVSIDGMSLIWIDDDNDFFIKNIKKALISNEKVIMHINREFIDNEIVDILANSKYGFFYIPNKFLTKEICKKGLQSSIIARVSIPEKFIDNEMLDIYNNHVKNNQKSKQYFNKLIESLENYQKQI